MADSIGKILADIASSIKSGGDLNNVLEDLAKNQKKAFDTTDPVKYQQALAKLQKQVKTLDKAEEAYTKTKAKAEEQLRDNNEQYDDTIKKLNRLDKVRKQASKNLQENMKKQAKVMNDAYQQSLANIEATKEHWRQNTRLGTAYSAVVGPLGKMAAGFTAGTMALKAFNKWIDSAKLKQELMIRSFGKLEDEMGWGEVATGVIDTEKALRHASASAIRFGFDTKEASNAMLEFQRITGEKSPKALGKMAEATMAVARLNGIDMATAMQNVKDRIDKFGGSASGAITSMANMREEAGGVNEAFGRTVVRMDDVIRSVNEITSAGTIYAVDQDFITKSITRNMTALQSQGESYDYAKAKAVDYIKAVTTEAPEFMQIRAGATLKKKFADIFTKDNALSDPMIKELEKAKPGISKKIKEILDSNADEYTKGQMIQELTRGTKAGIGAINDQIMELKEKHGDGAIQIIRQIYNTTEYGAKNLLDQAEAMKKEKKDMDSLETSSYTKMKETLKLGESGLHISKRQFEEMKGTVEGRSTLYDLSKQALMVAENEKRVKEEQRIAQEQMTNETKVMVGLQEGLNKAKQSGNTDDVKLQEKLIEKQQTKMSDLAGKLSKEQLAEYEKNQGKLIDNLDKVTESAKAQLDKSNTLSLTNIKATIEEWSGLLQTGGIAAALFLFKKSFDRMLDSFLDRLQKVLMGASGVNQYGGGGDGGFGGKGGKRGSFKRSWGSKVGRRFNTISKGLKKGGRFGKVLGGALDLAGRAGGGTMNALGKAGGLVSRFGGKAARAVGGVGKGLLKGGGGLLKGLSKGAGKLLGPMSGLLDFGINMMSGEGLGRSSVKAIGSTLGGALGGIGGSLVAPGVGTIAGGAGGAMAGDWLGGKVADWLGFEDPEAMKKGTSKTVTDQLQKQKTVQAQQSQDGGAVGSGVLRPKGQVIQDKMLLELDLGTLLSGLGAMQSKAING